MGGFVRKGQSLEGNKALSLSYSFLMLLYAI